MPALARVSMIFPDNVKSGSVIVFLCDFPRYPLQLNIGIRDSDVQRVPPATNENQYLATLGQLSKVEAFLADIEELVKI